MRSFSDVFYILFFVCLTGISPAWAQKDDLPLPVGVWESVDLVNTVEQFVPGKKSYKHDLFLKEFQCTEAGKTSIGEFTCEKGFVVPSDGKTRYPYFLKKEGDSEFLFLPWLSGDVTIHGEKPSYYVLKKVSSKVLLSKENAGDSDSFMIVKTATSAARFDNVRFKDLKALDLTKEPGLANTLNFNEKTVWPEASKLPKDFSPAKVLEQGMNPGLGVRKIHEQGITGKGVSVAIIDQPLFQDHPEFSGKIAAYFDTGCQSDNSMHGPAVTSLLVGTKCGTAPDAKVYFTAAPSWLADSAYYAKALEWILEQNSKLEGNQKIRVVSVSACPSGPGSPFKKNNADWDNAVKKAKEQGILVSDCSMENGFVGSCYYDPNAPDDVTKCLPGYPGLDSFKSSKSLLLVPCSPRTTAEHYEQKNPSYQFCARGGLSWGIPYCAGILALGWQVNPDLSGQQMKELLFKSAFINKDGYSFINPAEFIKLVQSSKKDKPAAK